MPNRIIDPLLSELADLPTPLTSGERRVVDFFNDHLPPDWEIYIQPFLNGLRPDVVLLNPAVGIAVFEVKDWSLDALDYYINHVNGFPGPAARNHDGKRIVLPGDKRDPLAQVMGCKKVILNLYCPRLGTSYQESMDQALAETRLHTLMRHPLNREEFNSERTVTAGLIFTGATTDRIRPLLEPLVDHQASELPSLHPISGFNDLRPGRMSVVFPEFDRADTVPMSEDLAEDLRGWLREPAFSREQRTPPDLDANQRRIATTRTETGFRRVQGPAGSGKTVALAARAAELAAHKKHVLICTFNITLTNYIRDLTHQYARTHGQQRPKIDIYHFHGWCTRVVLMTGRMDEYQALWAQYRREEVLDAGMSKLAESIWRGTEPTALPRSYDAILVDEGQDFRLGWWAALRAALAEGGEMLLIVDKTQDVYGTADAWTEEVMLGAGFRGPWSELRKSYRLPPAMIPLIRDFLAQFPPSEEIDVPESEQTELDMYPVDLNWIQTSAADAVDAIMHAVNSQWCRLEVGAAISDTTILCRKETGLKVVDRLQQKHVNVLHTFDKESDPRRERRLKLSFFQGSGKVKVTTLHSFKGWESARLVVFVDSVDTENDRAVFYAALTRIQRRRIGSALTVVCSAAKLETYGCTWPVFEKFTAEAQTSCA